MHKGFQGQRHALGGGLLLDFADFGDRTFTGQHHQLTAQLPRKGDPRRAGNRHLRGSVDRKVGR